MGDAYDLLKTKFSASRVVLSGVLRREDVSWRRFGAVNDRLEWVAKTLGVSFVDRNSWVDDWDFSSDGLHITEEARDIWVSCTLEYVVSAAKERR